MLGQLWKKLLPKVLADRTDSVQKLYKKLKIDLIRSDFLVLPMGVSVCGKIGLHLEQFDIVSTSIGMA